MIQYESSFSHSDAVSYESELMHHGVKGMKWGVRKYQNPDGSLTAEGKKATSGQIKRAARRAYKAEAKRIRKSTPFMKRLGHQYQDRLKAANYRIGAQKERALASKKKAGSFGQKYLQRSAYNADSFSKYYDSRSKNKSKKGSFKKLMKTPVKNTVTGKKQSYGKLYAKVLVAGVTVAAANQILQRRMQYR